MYCSAKACHVCPNPVSTLSIFFLSRYTDAMDEERCMSHSATDRTAIKPMTPMWYGQVVGVCYPGIFKAVTAPIFFVSICLIVPSTSFFPPQHLFRSSEGERRFLLIVLSFVRPRALACSVALWAHYRRQNPPSAFLSMPAEQ